MYPPSPTVAAIPPSPHLDRRYAPHELDEEEQYWVDHCSMLMARGYRLRPRYQPDWKPSWRVGTTPPLDCEDAIRLKDGIVCDAIRIKDGANVMLKRVNERTNPAELEAVGQFSLSSNRADTKNHAVPVYDTIADSGDIDDDGRIIAMPLLREVQDPRFDTFGEVIDFFRQIFEGVEYLHQEYTVHRDIMLPNIMMDATAMYPNSWHPMATSRNPNGRGKAKHYTRTQRPPRYYLVDFGISAITSTAAPYSMKMVTGGDKTVPEFQNAKKGDRFDPYPVDVYYVGNMISRVFLEGHGIHPPCLGFDFIRPLVQDMTQADPSKRPTITEVVKRFETIVSEMSTSKLRSRVIYMDEWHVLNIPTIITHWARRVKYTLLRVPAIPQQVQPKDVTK